MNAIRTVALILLSLLLSAGAQAQANSVTQSFSIMITSPFQITLTPPTIGPVMCEAAAGTLIVTLGTSGGNSGAVTFTMAPNQDFALQTNKIVVGPNGLAKTDCGQTITVSVTATQ